MSATTMLDVNDLIPSGAGFNPEEAAREQSQWVICFLSCDVRDREIGRSVLKLGTPTLIKSRPYLMRNDVALYEGKSKAMVAMARNPAGPAAEALNTPFAEWGLRPFKCLSGRDTDADVRFVAALHAAVLPDPFRFDAPTKDSPEAASYDPDWALFERRTARIRKIQEQFEPESVEALYCDTLLDANAATESYLQAFAVTFFAEAEQRRTHGASAGGRTRLYGDELRLLKWIKLHPSKYFDGYEEKEAAAPSVSVAPLPPELTAVLAALAADRTDKVTSLEAKLAEQSKQIEQLLALATAPAGDATKPKAK